MIFTILLNINKGTYMNNIEHKYVIIKNKQTNVEYNIDIGECPIRAMDIENILIQKMNSIGLTYDDNWHIIKAWCDKI